MYSHPERSNPLDVIAALVPNAVVTELEEGISLGVSTQGVHIAFVEEIVENDHMLAILSPGSLRFVGRHIDAARRQVAISAREQPLRQTVRGLRVVRRSLVLLRRHFGRVARPANQHKSLPLGVVYARRATKVRNWAFPGHQPSWSGLCDSDDFPFVVVEEQFAVEVAFPFCYPSVEHAPYLIILSGAPLLTIVSSPRL